MVYGQARPVSCYSSETSAARGKFCLDDGSYTLRSIGLCDPLKSDFSWSFCGVSDSSALEQLEFDITDGVCFVSPSSTPFGQPSGASSIIPTILPSLSPSFSPATTWEGKVSDYLLDNPSTATRRSAYTNIFKNQEAVATGYRLSAPMWLKY